MGINSKEEFSSEEKVKFQAAINLIGKTVDTGNRALLKFPTEHYDLELFMFINLLERFTVHLLGINQLLKQYANNPALEQPIGLIARAGLLDFMIITYISSYQADIGYSADPDGSRYKQQLNKILCDQVQFTFKFAREAKNSSIISTDEYKQVVESTVHNYSFLFTDNVIDDYEKPETKLVEQKTISPVQLFKRIHSHSLTIKFSMIYDLYTYYSKYEHFGIMTHFMQRQGVDVDMERIFGAVQYLIKGMGATFRYLAGPENILEKEINELDKLEEDFVLLTYNS